MKKFVFIISLFFSFYSSASAEIYLGIEPLSKLIDIKKTFPNAKFEKLTPSWVTESDAFFKMSGQGLSGIVYIKFSDVRPDLRVLLSTTEDEEFKKNILDFLSKQEDEVLQVDWIRWTPINPFPVQRLISKYGKPEKTGFANDDYKPFNKWEKRGIWASLSDDEKLVISIEYSFTNAEYIYAYKKNNRPLPSWLKDSAAIKK